MYQSLYNMSALLMPLKLLSRQLLQLSFKCYININFYIYQWRLIAVIITLVVLLLHSSPWSLRGTRIDYQEYNLQWLQIGVSWQNNSILFLNKYTLPLHPPPPPEAADRVYSKAWSFLIPCFNAVVGKKIHYLRKQKKICNLLFRHKPYFNLKKNPRWHQ